MHAVLKRYALKADQSARCKSRFYNGEKARLEIERAAGERAALDPKL